MHDPTPELPAMTRDRMRQDATALRRANTRLSTPFVVRRLVVVAIVAVLFLFVANMILDYGRGVSYERLGAPDDAVVGLLTRINPYLWWTLVVILGLIVFFWLKAYWSTSVEHERGVAVPGGTVSGLASELSPASLAVMRWVWTDHSEPFSLGDLKRTIAELRGGRIDKMQLVREQEALLRSPGTPAQTASLPSLRSDVAAPAPAPAAPQPGLEV